MTNNTDKPCETCNDDPEVCASIPGSRHCEKDNRETDIDKALKAIEEIIDAFNSFGETSTAKQNRFLIKLTTFTRTILEQHKMDENGLLPCPFCGEGEILIKENTYWTGMSSQILNVEIRHWCNNDPHKSMLTIKGKDRNHAISLWNTRATTAAIEKLLESVKD